MIINNENLFLIILAFIWIIGAILQDLRRREVDNIWNFSLIGIALSYRASASVFSNNYWFLVNGIIGLLIFIILGNVFYYSRVFAGGDAKLLIGLGPILPLSYNWFNNFKIFGVFLFLFLICGSLYVLFWALFLVAKNYKKFSLEFNKILVKSRYVVYSTFLLAFLWIIFVIVIKEYVLILLSFMIILFPLVYAFAKACEEACLIKSLKPTDITEGDWLYHDIFISGKKIKKKLKAEDVKIESSSFQGHAIINIIPFHKVEQVQKRKADEKELKQIQNKLELKERAKRKNKKMQEKTEKPSGPLKKISFRIP